MTYTNFIKKLKTKAKLYAVTFVAFFESPSSFEQLIYQK